MNQNIALLLIVLLGVILIAGCAREFEKPYELTFQEIKLKIPSQPFIAADWNVSERPHMNIEDWRDIRLSEYRYPKESVLYVYNYSVDGKHGKISVIYNYEDGKFAKKYVKLPKECFDARFPKIVARTQDEYDAELKSMYSLYYEDYKYNMENNVTDAGIPYSENYPDYSFQEFFDTCNKFPSIDFSQYALLGKFTQESGCEGFEKHIYRDDVNKRITYVLKKIKPPRGAICTMDMRASTNLILVPTIPSDYTVEFEVN